MIYTLNRGVDKQVKARLIRGTSLSLPLIALLFLVIAIFSFSSRHSAGQNPYIKSPSLSSSFSTQNGSKKAGPNSGSNSTGSVAASTNQASPAMSMNTLGNVSLPSTPVATSPAPSPVTGGLGGGDVGSGGTTTTPPSSGGTGGTTTPAQPTVACTNLLTLSQVCTACTPSIVLQPGQKALLSADGTCVAVN